MCVCVCACVCARACVRVRAHVSSRSQCVCVCYARACVRACLSAVGLTGDSTVLFLFDSYFSSAVLFLFDSDLLARRKYESVSRSLLSVTGLVQRALLACIPEVHVVKEICGAFGAHLLFQHLSQHRQ